MKITSSFENKADMNVKHTCQGDDISPELSISDVPEGAVSLVIICEDPDAPDPKAPKMVWDHWILFNIPPDTAKIPEGGSTGTSGINSWGRTGYGGPCPPIGKHRYFFKLFALDKRLELDSSANKKTVEEAMEGHILDKAELIGLYQKS